MLAASCGWQPLLGFAGSNQYEWGEAPFGIFQGMLLSFFGENMAACFTSLHALLNYG